MINLLQVLNLKFETYNYCVLSPNSNNLYKKTIHQISSKSPSWISDSATALSAIEKMNSLKVTSLLVTYTRDINKKNKNVIGVIHLHHCLSRGIKWKKNSKEHNYY